MLITASKAINGITCHLLLLSMLIGCGGNSERQESSSTYAFNSINETRPVSGYGAAPAPELISKYVQTAQFRQGSSALETRHHGLVAEAIRPATHRVTAMATKAMTITTPTTSVVAAVTTPELLIYVALNGNDNWSGLLPTTNATGSDGPLRTLAAAQMLARANLMAMAAGTSTRMKVRVIISAGTYVLTAPLNFTPDDSGTVGFPLVFEAQTPGSVVISGGVDLGSVTPITAGTPIVYNSPPGLPATSASEGGQFYVNARRAVLARQPNAGSYWFVQRPVALSTEIGTERGKEAFAPDATASTWIAGLDASSRTRAVVNVMQSWTASQHRFSASAPPTGAVRVAPRAYWSFLQFGTDQRYFIENVPAAFDAAGEWLRDAAGVKYLPLATEIGKPLQGTMPVLDKLLVVQGNSSTATWVRNLEFRGLTFSYTRYGVPAGGYTDTQAAVQIGAAIEVDGARQIIIDNCQVTHTGGYGIWLRNSVRNSTISNNVLTDMGAGGLKIGLTAQVPTDPDATGANIATSNRIQQTGLIFPGAVGIWIGQSYGNVISNNTIADTSYTGISIGWKWGYGGATSGNNSITNNLLVNIGSGWLSDLGAIYTLGESPGTVIRGNVIREVHAYPGYGAGAWGIYNDEGTSGVVIQNNAVINTDNGAYHLHYGRGNSLISNLFAFGGTAEFRVSKTDPLNTLLLAQSNLLLPKTTKPFLLYATAPDVLYSSNLVSGTAAAGVVDMTPCGTGCTSSNAKLTITSDPRALAVTGTSPTLVSQYKALGHAAGALTGQASTPVPAPVTAPAIPATLAPPLQSTIDIAKTNVGMQPLGLSYIAATPDTAITIVTNASAPSGVCLQFNDSAMQRYAWEPYAYAVLNHGSRTTTAQFSILADSTTDFIHEWRDSAIPYLTGPSLRITGTGIYVAGKQIFSLHSNTWLTIKISAKLGSAPAVWNLQITDSTGRTTLLNSLPSISTGWKSLNWAGFISNATQTSLPCVGSIDFTNQ